MKIIKFYLNRASYIALDENDGRTDLDIDYWEGKFEVSQENQELEKFAKKLLKKKHKINFVHKMLK